MEPQLFVIMLSPLLYTLFWERTVLPEVMIHTCMTFDFRTLSSEKGSHYRKYLTQFSETAQDPPKEVVETVLRELYKIHMMVSQKVKPTPVAQILRRHGLQHWCGMTVRICKLINNNPIPILSDMLIDRLVWQFVTKLQDSRRKTHNFTFVTRKLLHSMGEIELFRRF